MSTAKSMIGIELDIKTIELYKSIANISDIDLNKYCASILENECHRLSNELVGRWKPLDVYFEDKIDGLKSNLMLTIPMPIIHERFSKIEDANDWFGERGVTLIVDNENTAKIMCTNRL